MPYLKMNRYDIFFSALGCAVAGFFIALAVEFILISFTDWELNDPTAHTWEIASITSFFITFIAFHYFQELAKKNKYPEIPKYDFAPKKATKDEERRSMEYFENQAKRRAKILDKIIIVKSWDGIKVDAAVKTGDLDLKTGEVHSQKAEGPNAETIIITKAPKWKGGGKKTEALLALCYTNCLNLAESKGIQTIAFPSISTGFEGFPLERAAHIATTTIFNHLKENSKISKVYIVTSNQAELEKYYLSLIMAN